MNRLILGFIALLASAFSVAQASAQSFNSQEQAEIRAVVRDYLVNNPDVLQEALTALSVREAAERRRRIENDPRDFAIGPRNAPITLVEFYDYRCPYCHAALEWVEGVVATRNDVRVILKELPVLGPQSLEASRASLAAQPQGRYWNFHKSLMGFQGDLTSDRIDSLARASGIDVARMRRAMESEEVTSHLQETQGLAVDSNMRQTPTFMINGQILVGFRKDLLDQALAEATRATRTAHR